MVDPVLPFGKHRGLRVSEVPTNYLAWMLGECDGLEAYLRIAAREELARRRSTRQGRAMPDDHEPHRATEPGTGQQSRSVVDLRSVVQHWFRDLSMRWHPDRGGSVHGMAAVNDAHEKLCKLLGV